MKRRRPSRAGRLEAIAEPGTLGRLEVLAEHEGETVEHQGEYVYVGIVHGLHVFAPASDEPVLYLHRHQVAAFRAMTALDGGAA